MQFKAHKTGMFVSLKILEKAMADLSKELDCVEEKWDQEAQLATFIYFWMHITSLPTYRGQELPKAFFVEHNRELALELMRKQTSSGTATARMQHHNLIKTFSKAANRYLKRLSEAVVYNNNTGVRYEIDMLSPLWRHFVDGDKFYFQNFILAVKALRDQVEFDLVFNLELFDLPGKDLQAKAA